MIGKKPKPMLRVYPTRCYWGAKQGHYNFTIQKPWMCGLIKSSGIPALVAMALRGAK